MNVKCFDITGQIDNSEANVKAVVFFRLSGTNKHGKGGVTVHLHHTKRKLQIQGGALMPDRTKSPVWFVQNVISKRFHQLGKSKAFDVNNFNNIIRELITSQSIGPDNSCTVCNIQFTGRSQPEFCLKCKKSFHKKCHTSKQHLCHRNIQFSNLKPPSMDQNSDGLTAELISARRLSSNPAIPQPLALPNSTCPDNPQTNPVTQPLGQTVHTPRNPTLATTSTTGHSLPVFTTSISRHSSEPRLIYSNNDPQATQTVPVPVLASISQPTLLTSTSQPTLSQANNRTNQYGPGHSVRTKAVKKSTKITPPIDQSSIENECIRKQLNIAHTKIQELEAELEKTKTTNYIIGERIKLFEATNTKDMYEKYFPPQSSD